ncbi:hypothetical protein [Elizabethkingia meningoseptica]|nr:hypothetical protein [Elizabethkingia meningoseptica]MDE5430611.1 YiiG family protein [Elizabethkingia meningoseptica]MDE5526606.1 YiiG family protein [Elizabethkingia meningoseptica]
MKKIIIAAGIITFSFSVVSCNKIKEKLSEQNKTVKIDPFSVNSGDENRDIIAFNNKVVKLDEVQSNYIRNFQDMLGRMDTFVKNATANPDLSIMAPIFTPTVMMGAHEKMEAPKVLGNDYQKLLDKMIVTFSGLRLLEDELKSYKEAEDWKDDKGKKVTEISDKAKKLIEENRKTAGVLFDKLKSKSDKAEAEILKDHPLRKQIVQSKETIEFTQKIIDDSYTITDPEAYKKLFARQYQDLEKLYNRNTEEKIPSEEMAKEASYTAFNNAVNAFLGKMRIVQRSLNDNSDQLNSDLDDLEREGGYVLDRYNSFVD